ncbi:NAD(P)-dependent oxidoreductase [Limnohabitans sp. 15K]|uniref:NAD(P)-dependent oxidoreductase n=1 Tax=Limnohabitans sp. 15K TaxID=1100706 RepID=UPI000C1EACD1|nr:NAD(P)-dependent oxidoreductase [Limnohabitans sp. 15K]PIT82635.1 hypothetical protein B9Z40_02650 [Limnohabitans sp. 15K]
MPKLPKIIVEMDVFTRLFDVILNKNCNQDLVAAFADFFAHDVPDFESWLNQVRQQCVRINPASIVFVDSADELRRELPDAVAVVVESLQIGEAELNLAPELLAVQKFGFVTRNIDLDACARRNVDVLTLRRRANMACAEQAMMMMLALAKRLPELNGRTTMKRLQDAGFKPAPFDRRYAPNSNWARVSGISMLYGATLGIIGLGEIGRELALRAHAFGMKIIYTQRTQLDRATEEALHVEYRNMDSLLRESDWLVPQLPTSPSTEGLLDAEKLSKIKKGARLVNVSRAQVMDKNAVLAALESGALGGFALDTLWSEPGSEDDQLLSFSNVILTPHMAGSPRFNATADFEEMIVKLDQVLSLRTAKYS